MFYTIYCSLCQGKGISPSRAAMEMGINKGTVSVWKNKGTTPQAAQLNKISEYFGVSVDYLLGKSSHEGFSPPSLDELDFALYGETHSLSAEEKQDILDYVRFKKAQKER